MIFPLMLVDSSLIVSYAKCDVPSSFASTSSSGSCTEASSSSVMASPELNSSSISSRSSTFSPCVVSEVSISPDV